jgi:hypothetical protein
MVVKLLLGRRALRRNDKKPVQGVGGEFYYVNGTSENCSSVCSALLCSLHYFFMYAGISVAQGPNYGKRICRNKKLDLCSKMLINSCFMPLI